MNTTSPFIQQLQQEMQRIRDIIKSPKSVVKSFNTLLAIHSAIERLTDDYTKSSTSRITHDAIQSLTPIINSFKTSYKTDIKRVDQLNQSILRNQTNLHIPSFREVVDESVELYVPELYESDIYTTLADNVNLSITRADLNKPEVKEMIQEYNNTREEIENGLDEYLADVQEYERRMMSAGTKIVEKSKPILQQLYVSHLNYLKTVLASPHTASPQKACISGQPLLVNGSAVCGKQSEFVGGWLKY